MTPIRQGDHIQRAIEEWERGEHGFAEVWLKAAGFSRSEAANLCLLKHRLETQLPEEKNDG